MSLAKKLFNFGRPKQKTPTYSYGKVFPSLRKAYSSVRQGEFFINHNGVMYPFKWDMSAGRDAPTVFFLPGRVDRKRPTPIYQRSTFSSQLQGYNCISCFDPTLFLEPELTLAWFQGTGRRFYAAELAQMWRQFTTSVGFDASNMLYFGTSGGGIPGFHLAKKTPGSTLFMSNVQTDIRQYYLRFVEELVNVSFNGNMDYLNNASETRNRFCINGHSGNFHLVYAQNKADEFHYARHYKKFRQHADADKFKSLRFIEYDDPESGHGTLGNERECRIIQRIFDKASYEDIFPNAQVEQL